MLGETLVVVSDAHITGDTAEATESFLAFLERVPTLGDCLLVNGDLFEFWFSYRRAVPRAGFLVAAAIAMLRRKIPIAMTGGNHDRWGHSFWRQEANIQYAPGELRLEVGARRVIAVHGDDLPAETRSASLVHSVISNPITARIFSALHPDWGLWLVDRMGGHLADQTTDPAILDRAQERQVRWARGRLETDETIDLIVLSHTHRAETRELLPGRHYLNPGAWMLGQRYAVVTPTAVELRQFS